MNNKRVEKSLYQPNVLSYYFILLTLALNTYFVLQILNVITRNHLVGVHILFNIFFSLLLFLSAVRLKTYSKNWSVAIVLIGLFQIARAFIWMPPEVIDNKTTLTLVLVVSGVLMVASGILTMIKVLRQETFKKHNKIRSESLK